MFKSSPLPMLLAVAVGSAIGGVARILLTEYIQWRVNPAFPLGTLIVNVTGCLVIGVLIGVSVEGAGLSLGARAFLITGFCGGYTTFSTFALESVQTIDDGARWTALGYIGVSVVLGVASVWIGMAAVRQIVTRLAPTRVS